MTGSPVSWPRDVVVLIPAYQAAGSLSMLLPALLQHVPAGQVLVVDDGSGDDTRTVCRDLGIECISHPHNRGKGAALRTGFGATMERKVRYAITMDADGQHAFADLPVFLDAMSAKPAPALCIGHRDIHPRRMPVARVCSNLLTSTILSLLTGVPIRDSQCGYRAYAMDFVRTIEIEYDFFEMETEVVLKACRAGLPVRFVPIQTVYSNARSHISHVRDTARWVRAVLRMWCVRRRSVPRGRGG